MASQDVRRKGLLQEGRTGRLGFAQRVVVGGVARHEEHGDLERESFQLFGRNLRVSAFEPATILALTSIIHVSWRGPLWITTTIAVTWTLILSLVFQLVFRIPLPGSF